MTTPKEGVIQYLASAPTVTEFVGTRVYPNKAPQGTNGVNYLIVEQVGFEPRHNSSGADSAQAAQFSIVCYGINEQQADSMADAVRLALHGRSKGSLGGLNHRGVFLDDVRDVSQPPANADEIGFPAKEVLVTVWFQ